MGLRDHENCAQEGTLGPTLHGPLPPSRLRLQIPGDPQYEGGWCTTSTPSSSETSILAARWATGLKYSCKYVNSLSTYWYNVECGIYLICKPASHKDEMWDEYNVCAKFRGNLQNVVCVTWTCERATTYYDRQEKRGLSSNFGFTSQLFVVS